MGRAWDQCINLRTEVLYPGVGWEAAPDRGGLAWGRVLGRGGVAGSQLLPAADSVWVPRENT